MKFAIMFSFLMFTFSAFGLSYEDKVKCFGDNCFKQTTYSGLKEKPIRIDEYKNGQCLVQLVNQKPTFFQVLKAEPSSRKITFLKEDSYDTKNYVHVLAKVIIFDKELENTYLKPIPCGETNSFFDQSQIDQCLKNRNFMSKVYCNIK